MMPVPTHYSVKTQFHILRHFNRIDADYRRELVEQTDFTDSDIRSQLAIVGSKFNPGFAKNPVQLWEKIQSHEQFFYPDIGDWKEKRFPVIVSYSLDDYPGGVGEDTLIRLGNLLPAEKTLLKKQDRDGILVNHLQTTKTNPTWQVNVILWREKELIVRTIFPGIYAPPFPDPQRQNEKELLESKRFWDQHAFCC